MSEETIAEPVPGGSRGRPVRCLVAPLLRVTLFVLFIGATFFFGWYHTEFHTWPWSSGLPHSVTYCGRHYIGRGRPVTSTEASAREKGTIREVGRNGIWGHKQAIYANPLSEQARADNPPLPCAMAIYLRTAEDRYVPYILSGGP